MLLVNQALGYLHLLFTQGLQFYPVILHSRPGSVHPYCFLEGVDVRLCLLHRVVPLMVVGHIVAVAKLNQFWLVSILFVIVLIIISECDFLRSLFLD